MYCPQSFRVSDPAVLFAFMEQYSFATLVSTIEGTPFASHLPLTVDRDHAPQGAILGHMARANPHWQAFDGPQEVLAIFHGPHSYISPTWHVTEPAVPTWNYAAVHVYGIPRIIEDQAWLSSLVDRLSAIHEAGRPQPWTGEVPADFKAKLLRAIVGFEITITRIEGKFKFGQNRPHEDQLQVVQQLEQSADPVARNLGEMTKQRLEEESS